MMRSDFVIVKGVFVALSYHLGGVVYSMIYDNERRVCVSELGPILKYVEEFSLDSAKLSCYYGDEVAAALREFSLKG